MSVKRWMAGLATSLVVAFCAGSPDRAQALDLDIFGWFSDKPPAPSEQALSYKLEFQLPDDASDAKQSLQDASNLYRLRQEPPPDGRSLVRRAQGDLGPLLDAMWGSGYYNATVEIRVADVLVPSGADVEAAARAAENLRNSAVVPITVTIVPGPLFKIRNVNVVETRTNRPFSLGELPPRFIKIEDGQPARAGDIRAAEAVMIDHFRAQSYPLVKATRIEPVVYHRLNVLDVTFYIDRGPKAPIGDVTLAGQSEVDPKVVKSFIYIRRGDPYSPRVLEDTRKSILQVPAIGSVRFREGEQLDSEGMLPLTAEVGDRKKRVIGFSARYSTLDGPLLHGYWQHRNLFGGGESLRLESDLFLRPDGTSSLLDSLRHFDGSDIGGRVKATFMKPALGGSRNDLLVDAMVERDATGGDQYGGYTSDRFVGNIGIRHRFSRTFSVQAGLAGEFGRTEDTLGVVNYTLVGVPVSVTYDSTDQLLDPTRGMRIAASVTPYPGFLGSSVGLVETRGRASAYYSFDEDARVVLAGMLGVGSIVGPKLSDIPSTHRFYAGGGGSVRGFRYQSLSPLGPTGQVVGGRSLFEASVEARVKVTDTIGLVPFFDMGNAFDAAYPDFNETLRYSAGLGLRYYTAIGPIRVDVALPINRRPGDSSYGIYVGIGQAF